MAISRARVTNSLTRFEIHTSDSRDRTSIIILHLPVLSGDRGAASTNRNHLKILHHIGHFSLVCSLIASILIAARHSVIAGQIARAIALSFLSIAAKSNVGRSGNHRGERLEKYLALCIPKSWPRLARVRCRKSFAIPAKKGTDYGEGGRFAKRACKNLIEYRSRNSDLIYWR